MAKPIQVRGVRIAVAAVITILSSTFLSGRSFAQDAQTPDSEVQKAFEGVEAAKAMEAAADSAGKVAEAPALEAPSKAADTSSVSIQTSDTIKPAPEDEFNPGDTTGKTIRPDTTQMPRLDSLPADTGTEDAQMDTSKTAASRTDTAKTVTTQSSDTTTQTSEVGKAEQQPAKQVDPKAPYKDIQFAAGEKPRVIMETSMGKIVLELWPDVAPKSCQSFVYLVGTGFYDSLTVHRVVPGFLIQAGDPGGTGTGGPGYSVPSEFSTKLLHEDGTLAMARRVDPQLKTGSVERPEYLNSAGSQFFICLDRTESLDGKYTVFGKVVEGLDVVHRIAQTPAQRERPVAPVLLTKVSLESQI